MSEEKRSINARVLAELQKDLASFAESHNIDTLDLIVSLKLTLDELANKAGVDLLAIKIAKEQPPRTLH